jgi:hypothetical protein
MLNINEEDLKSAIVERAADEILRADNDLSSMIAKEVKSRLDVIFKDRAETQIAAAIDAAIVNGFEREYQRTNQWGEPSGPKTSIKAELGKIVEGFWNARVDAKSGKPTESSYSSVSRAEFLMTQICAQDFSETMKQHALNVTGALKDGLRNQLAKHMDEMLSGLFHVKSLQDQGKVEKPW